MVPKTFFHHGWLFLVWGSLALTTWPAMAGSAADPQPDPAHRIHLGSPSVSVVWEAVARDTEGIFRVYRGGDPTSLTLVWQGSALTGRHSYRVFDRPPEHGVQVYQLRYLSPSGTDIALETIEVVRGPLVGDAQAPATSTGQQPLWLLGRSHAGPQEPAAGRLARPSQAAPASFSPEPPDPPPRLSLTA